MNLTLALSFERSIWRCLTVCVESRVAKLFVRCIEREIYLLVTSNTQKDASISERHHASLRQNSIHLLFPDLQLSVRSPHN